MVPQLGRSFRVRKASMLFQQGLTPRAAITKAVVKVTRKDSRKNPILANMGEGDGEKIQKTSSVCGQHKDREMAFRDGQSC